MEFRNEMGEYFVSNIRIARVEADTSGIPVELHIIFQNKWALSLFTYRKGKSISWTNDAAKKYATFLIAHEIAHVLYAKRKGLNDFDGKKSSASEEKWCDSFARAVIAKITKLK